MVQLAWSNMLSNQEIADLFIRYENELKTQLMMEQEKIRHALHFPNRNSRESFIWEMISENIISTYNNELNWVRETQKKLLENKLIEKKEKTNYQIREIDNKKYIEVISTTKPQL